jgi:FkbM family methyltransferase
VILGVNEFTYTLLASLEPGRIAGLVDDYRQGQELSGIPCLTSDEFYGKYRNSRDALFVDCARYGRANLHFRGLALRTNVETVNFEQAVRLLKPKALDYRVEDHLPAILEHEHSYRKLEQRLGDELSRETLRRVLLYHMTTCRDLYRPVERPYETLYFRSGLFDPRPDERFVDCGASIGESISGLLEVTGFSLDAAWLIEPDRSNVITLEKLLAKLRVDCPRVADRIRLVPSAVGEAAGKVSFRHAGGHGGNVVAAPADGDVLVSEVDVVAIDDIVEQPVTMIKMDVEGYELHTLRGAKRSIASHRPRLCVSAYHRSSDLIDLSNFVLSLRDDYRVGLRHHTPLRWDTCLYFY